MAESKQEHFLMAFYPWLLWIGLYFFVAGTDYPTPSYKTAALKILPILTLAFMVLATRVFKIEQHLTRKRWIAAGLLFSAVGDFFMVWIRTHMFYGGIAFAVAHLCYIVGFVPLSSAPQPEQNASLTARRKQKEEPKESKGNQLPVFIVTLALFGGISAWLYPRMGATFSPEEKAVVLMYLGLLCLVSFRATSMAVSEVSVATVCASLGTYIFIVSDMIILTDKYVYRVDRANLWIMVTYYLAQLGIASSVAFLFHEGNMPQDDNKPKRMKRTRFTSK